MRIHEVFLNAVRKCVELPDSVRAGADHPTDLRESTFDSTYLEFLDQQIELDARGPDWTDRLRRRRQQLADWCDRSLLDAHVRVGQDLYWIKVDASQRVVAYWERYESAYTV